MPASTRPARDQPGEPDSQPANVVALTLAGWLVPGAAHLFQGMTQKALVFFVTLVGMFAIGISLGGRLFPLQVSDPLVLLQGAAEWLLGLPRVVAWLGGYGQGDVVAATYEYGNTFLVVGGLLNALILLDAYDRATGRKNR